MPELRFWVSFLATKNYKFCRDKQFWQNGNTILRFTVVIQPYKAGRFLLLKASGSQPLLRGSQVIQKQSLSTPQKIKYLHQGKALLSITVGRDRQQHEDPTNVGT